ncbi:MAG: peptidylprolyl isomerase, partial [Bacteroidota bacterium]
EERAKNKLLKIKSMIEDGDATFSQAASEYSDDQQTKDIGGMVSDPKTGSYKIPLDKLEVDLYLAIDEMEVGDISEPIEVFQKGQQIEKAYEIVYLRERHPPHRASLETDYEKFAEAARQAKQAEALDEWFENAKSQVYIEIKHEGCEQALQEWYRASK